MKLSNIFYLSLTCGYSQAEDSSEDLPLQDGKHLWQQANMLQSLVSQVFPDKRDAFEFVYKYGCYCHSSFRMTGSANNYHGPALDELDSLCRDSHRAQRCLEDEFGGSLTGENKRDRSYPWYLDANTNQIVCNNQNNPAWASRDDNQMRLRNCLIEKEFVESIVDLINGGTFERNENWIKMNNNKYANACPTTANGNPGGSGGKICCGTGLSAKPYNTATKICCDNEVQELGTC